MATYNEQLQHLVDRFFEETKATRATKLEIAGWMLREDLWKPPPEMILRKAAEDLARAMREDYYIDPQGRHVRVKHAARIVEDGVQSTFWADLRFASEQHMEIALKQRRTQVVADCHQLKMDVDSYNQNRKPAKPIQMSFDFTLDLEEMDAVAGAA